MKGRQVNVNCACIKTLIPATIPRTEAGKDAEKLQAGYGTHPVSWALRYFTIFYLILIHFALP